MGHFRLPHLRFSLGSTDDGQIYSVSDDTQGRMPLLGGTTTTGCIQFMGPIIGLLFRQ